MKRTPFYRRPGRTGQFSGLRERVIWMADAGGQRRERINPLLQREESRRLAEGMPEASRLGIADRVAYANNRIGNEGETLRPGRDAVLNGCINGRPLEVNGFWRDADWLLCRDGKWRPVEPGTFPLVDGAAARLGRVEPGVARVASSNRVGRLKGYGNAINAQAAAEFIRAYMERL